MTGEGAGPILFVPRAKAQRRQEEKETIQCSNVDGEDGEDGKGNKDVYAYPMLLQHSTVIRAERRVPIVAAIHKSSQLKQAG